MAQNIIDGPDVIQIYPNTYSQSKLKTRKQFCKKTVRDIILM